MSPTLMSAAGSDVGRRRAMISMRSSQEWCVEPGGSGTKGIVIEAESVARGIPGMISASIRKPL